MKNKQFISSLSLFSLVILASCGNTQNTITKESETETTTATATITTTEIDPDIINWDDEVLGEAKVDPCSDNYRTFYEIFTSSFSDSNGDGTGDLKGILNRLDYLNDGNINSGKSLGIQGIWLTPIFKSPSYHKYDVTDYYSIDSKFGTLEDLTNLLEECHKRNVKLILDLVINHTSVNNTWFVEFKRAHKNGDTESKYYDYYEWYETTPQGHTSTQISGTTHFYESNFSSEMPELNYENEAVYEEIVNVGKYWIDQGVDGFRFDAARYIYFNNTTKNTAFWDRYVKDIKDYAMEKYNKDLYTIAEVWDSDATILPYNTSVNTFNFSVGQGEGYISSAVKSKNGNSYTSYITNFLKKLNNVNENAMLAQFIANHDTDRAAGYLTISSGDAHMAANLYLLCSGSPFIYYGEEIGMKGSRGSAQTDANRRLAMLWGDDDTVKNPKGTTYSSEYQVNGTVESQINSKSSLLTRYRKLIQIRNNYDAIRKGKYEAINSKDDLGIFKVTYNDEVIYIIHNLSYEDINLDLTTINASSILEEIGLNKCTINNNTLTIGSRTSVIVK